LIERGFEGIAPCLRRHRHNAQHEANSPDAQTGSRHKPAKSFEDR